MASTSKSKAQTKEQAARVHGGQSNRRTKDRGESKTVFKSVLANPFEVKWPVISPNVQNAILARVVDLLQGVAEYNLNRHKQSRETRAERRALKRAKKASKQNNQNTMDVDTPQQNNTNADPGASTKTSSSSAPAPEILQHVTVGINAVTKRLEAQCLVSRQIISFAETRSNRDTSAATANSGTGDGVAVSADRNQIGDVDGGEVRAETMDDTDTAGPPSPAPAAAPAQRSASPSAVSSSINPPRAPIRTVLVCRADIDPPLLIAHIPHLVAACNSSTRDPNANGSGIVKLVSLPKTAEESLAAAMALRRVSVLAFDDTLSSDTTLSSLLSSVQTVVAPWLVGVLDSPACSTSGLKPNPPKPKHVLPRRLEPTHIKQLRTTAPKDMRAAKALRTRGKAEAKTQRKAKEAAKKAKLRRGSLEMNFITLGAL